MATPLYQINTKKYQQACLQEADYWGREALAADEKGICFSADMERAQRIFVDRGPGLPQQQIYDPEAEKIMNGALYQFIFDAIRSHDRAARILVLTCGAGGLCLELARRGHDVLGIDISPGAIRVAQKYLRENPIKKNFGKLSYRINDLNRIELPKSSFDIVLAWDGLHHILLQERLMLQIQKSLKANGLFIFSDNIGMHWLSRIIGGALYMVLPTFVGYRHKIKIALAGERHIKKNMQQRSPFEEINTKSMLPLVQKYFRIYWQRAHTGIGFRSAIAGDVRFPDPVKHSFLRFLKKLDEWAVQSGLLKGDHVLIIARPV